MSIRIPVLVALLITAGITHAQPDCEPIGSLEPLDTWQTISGSYEDGGWVIYSVVMDLNVNYVFKTGCGDGATADHDTKIEWMTPICTVIMTSDDGCEDGRSLLSFNSFFEDGITLWIRVRGAEDQGGSFTMAYRSIGGAPGQCNSCPSYDAQLAPSSQWQTHEGSYSADGCMVYRMFIQAGMEYTFKTGCGDGATADNDTQLEVLGNACTNITSDDDGCELGRSTVTWTATAQGTAYVKVNGANDEAGTFTLAYRRSGGNGSTCGSCPAQDFSIIPGINWATSTSSYLSTGCQMYKVSVTAGFNYTFKTGCGNGASADHDTQLELFDADCTLLASDDNGCDAGASIIEYVPTSTGFLYLKVSGANGAEGFYTLAYRKSGTCTTCPAYDAQIAPTPAWQTASGSYYNDGCWSYKVDVTEGHTYVFQTACGNGASSDHLSALQLLDANCFPLENSSYSCIYHLAAATGEVYLRVHGLPGEFGAFTMAYRDVGSATDNCEDATPIQLAGTVELSGTLADATSDGDFAPTSPWYGSPVKWYAIELPQPCEHLVVSYCGQVPVWPSTLGMVATTCPAAEVWMGTPPVDPCEEGNASYYFTEPQPGTYYLPLLYDPANSVDGAYTIAVTCLNDYIVGIKEVPKPDRSIYPNPGHDELWLNSPLGQHAAALVQIQDLLGRTVAQAQVSTYPAVIGTGALPPGMYVVHVQDGAGAASFKWVKE